MNLIFIRHGDPDYKNNTVTEKGLRESQYLAERVSKWNVTDFYVSPYGRAQDTIKPALLAMNKNAEILDWLKEFDYKVIDPSTKKERGCCWDLLPRDFFCEKKYTKKDSWYNVKHLKKADIQNHYKDVCNSFDSLLAQYDYTRMSPNSAIYNCLPHLTEEESQIDTHLLAQQKNLDERNIVFVCHLGVMFLLISHLTNISPMQLWQSFFVAPTSVTVLGAEERIPGEVVFRVQKMGDVSHLLKHNEPTSASGFFGCCSDF